MVFWRVFVEARAVDLGSGLGLNRKTGLFIRAGVAYVLSLFGKKMRSVSPVEFQAIDLVFQITLSLLSRLFHFSFSNFLPGLPLVV